MARDPKRFDPWIVAFSLVYLAGMVAAVIWAAGLEKPIPCSGRVTCGAGSAP